MNQTVIRTLIVDDEKYSREELIFLLKSFPRIEVVGQAASGNEAMMKIIALKPELIFLDVEMPGMKGTEIAAIIKEMETPPIVIFATAYAEFAVEAFQLQAKGYLLKPFEERELVETIKRIEQLRSLPSQIEEHAQAKGKLAVETEDAITFLKPRDIRYVSRESGSTKIVSIHGTYETKTTLKDLEARLAPHDFFRVHKSYLVNTSMITEMTVWFNGAYQLALKGSDEKIPVSRNYAKELRAKIEL